MSNLIYGIFYADGYVDGGRDTKHRKKTITKTESGSNATSKKKDSSQYEASPFFFISSW